MSSIDEADAPLTENRRQCYLEVIGDHPTLKMAPDQQRKALALAADSPEEAVLQSLLLSRKLAEQAFRRDLIKQLGLKMTASDEEIRAALSALIGRLVAIWRAEICDPTEPT